MKSFVAALLCCTILFSAGISFSAGFENATPGRILGFPKDHGKHPNFKTEWWYFTGNLDAQTGEQFGFQLTFFRFALLPTQSKSNSAWAIGDIWPAHFAITNVDKQEFYFTELMSRTGPALAGAPNNDLDVKVKNWGAKREGESIRIQANEGDYAIDLDLRSNKPIALHGDGGFSKKSGKGDQASYYYSFTRLDAEGTLTYKGKVFNVTGLAWMDHEFGSSILETMQVGWDWFSLQLSDGSELMVSYIRNKTGGFERPFGSFIAKDGTITDLASKKIVVKNTGKWRSPKSKAEYPSGWEIQAPELDIALEIQPLLKNQELVTANSTGIAYWEGAVKVTGKREGKEISGRGYVELTGYAGSMGGLL